MQWTDVGIILNARLYGERSHILTVFTENHGRCVGLYKSSAKTKAAIQPGNLVQAKWSARLPEHLGMWQLEMIDSPSSRLMLNRLKLNALGAALSLADQLMAEQHVYPELYSSLSHLIHQLVHGDEWGHSYVDYELKLLNELGFGLDLSKCAATGRINDLIYLSPKTGRAVSREAGQPYDNLLFKIPEFWLHSMPINFEQLHQALVITSHFLQKDLLEEGLPTSRISLQLLLREKMNNANSPNYVTS